MLRSHVVDHLDFVGHGHVCSCFCDNIGHMSCKFLSFKESMRLLALTSNVLYFKQGHVLV